MKESFKNDVASAVACADSFLATQLGAVPAASGELYCRLNWSSEGSGSRPESLLKPLLSMVEESEVLKVVIDTGSDTVKVGYGGEDRPQSVFPAVVGKPKLLSPAQEKQIFVGDEAMSKKGVLNISRPIGAMTNWDDIERIWEHAFFNELREPPEEHSCLLADISPPSPLTREFKRNRERMAELFFETFNSPAFYIANQAVLALYASGRVTGLIVDCGELSCRVVPIYEGYALSHATMKTEIGGCDATQYLSALLHCENTSFFQSVCRDIKERLCYVAIDYERELLCANEIEICYELPCGFEIKVHEPKFMCPEIFFQPSLIGKDLLGVHRVVSTAISRCDQTLQGELQGNIVLSGGSSMFPGFAERFTKELSAFQSAIILTVASPEHKFSTWSGGSILTTLKAFEQSWIKRSEYWEKGSSIVHRHCI